MGDYIFSLEGIEPVDATPYQFLPIQLEWLEALESGKFKQGRGQLRSSTDEYCCLGVLAELSGCDRRLANIGTAYEYRDKNMSGKYTPPGFLPFGVRIAARLHSDLGSFKRSIRFPGVYYGEPLISGNGHGSLASMNDVRILQDDRTVRSFNFSEIAAYIRHDPWNIFTAPNVIDLSRPVPQLDMQPQAEGFA